MTDGFVHWRRLIAINIALMAGYVVYRISRDFLNLAYIQLLADYHFGFIKRGLVGAVMGLAFPKVPQWMPFAIGTVSLVATFALYLKLFQKTYGFERRNAALFVFIAGSPLFFKNFITGLGFFDIFGCAFAMVMMLIPPRSFAFVVLGAAGSLLLLLIHHVQILIYIPLIVATVAIRYYAARPVHRGEIAAGLALLLAIGIAFVFIMFVANPAVPEAEFFRHLQSRADSRDDTWMGFVYVWYRPFLDELWFNWSELPRNLLYLPVYIAVVALHAPLIAYFRTSIDALARPRDRTLVWAALALVSAGYLLLLGSISYDFGRWVGEWAVCLMLVMHLVPHLPRREEVAPIPTTNWPILWLGFIVTLIPRVGLIRPF